MIVLIEKVSNAKNSYRIAYVYFLLFFLFFRWSFLSREIDRIFALILHRRILDTDIVQ